MIRLHLVVEEQSEERFVKELLRPHLQAFEVETRVSVVKTSRSPGGSASRGGGGKPDHCLSDLRNVLKDPNNRFVSCILDLYGFPVELRSAVVAQDWLAEQIGDTTGRFIPFFAKHEFEAWLLSDPKVLAGKMGAFAYSRKITGFVEQAGGPEEVDGGRETHPKARILQIFPRYRPTLHSPAILSAIGLGAIRRACPHFEQWLSRLENLQCL